MEAPKHVQLVVINSYIRFGSNILQETLWSNLLLHPIFFLLPLNKMRLHTMLTFPEHQPIDRLDNSQF
ncbi:hypothetical protein Ahy_B08g091220 isoform H [Arachis hypogaea]|uniref:Uncharacterized protein n=1 Tax=Arachis hypogaea TaxID=3818 RepID=A0A444Y1M1_ARAHY|nr:hypothetical protein Ahy_B08g091220 isoform H [Arachis hypogaea]